MKDAMSDIEENKGVLRSCYSWRMWAMAPREANVTCDSLSSVGALCPQGCSQGFVALNTVQDQRYLRF